MPLVGSHIGRVKIEKAVGYIPILDDPQRIATLNLDAPQPQRILIGKGKPLVIQFLIMF
jgi:hypothetical protein